MDVTSEKKERKGMEMEIVVFDGQARISSFGVDSKNAYL